MSRGKTPAGKNRFARPRLASNSLPQIKEQYMRLANGQEKTFDSFNDMGENIRMALSCDNQITTISMSEHGHSGLLVELDKSQRKEIHHHLQALKNSQNDYEYDGIMESGIQIGLQRTERGHIALGYAGQITVYDKSDYLVFQLSEEALEQLTNLIR